jgi:hypothetical protein
MLVLTVGQVFFQPIQALTFQMFTLIFQMVCKKRHMTKLIVRKKLQTHIISGEQKLTFNLFFFKLAIHVFWATKIGRKTRKFQNILQDNLQAEH